MKTGIAEAFRREVAHIGIQSMIVEPGYFRTKLLAAGNAKKIETKFKEYEDVSTKLYEIMNQVSERQPGDPEKGVDIILDVVRGEGKAAGRGIPERLLLGPDAVEVVRKKCEDTLKLVKEWEELSSSTNF